MSDPAEVADLPQQALSARDRFRVELIMQLAELLARNTETIPIEEAADRLVGDVPALAEWILERFAEVERDAIQLAAADVESLELSQAAIVELAAAHATFTEVAAQTQRVQQIRAILQRGLTITQSADLAATLGVELDGLRSRLSGILGKYPELQQLMRADVVARSQSLVDGAGRPIV